MPEYPVGKKVKATQEICSRSLQKTSSAWSEPDVRIIVARGTPGTVLAPPDEQILSASQENGYQLVQFVRKGDGSNTPLLVYPNDIMPLFMKGDVAYHAGRKCTLMTA